ncbi:hypothetical protein KSF81_11725 [Siccirubricoccus sp. G192]|nr:hypothetical protein [Siccirubricoccus sp. G192]MBV1797668.1 hypothetical protein [Siccirubricoccus sp. G192]
MADHQAGGMRHTLRQAAYEQAGGGGGDHHIRRQHRADGAEQGLLHLIAFRRIFLDEVAALGGGGGIGLEAPARGVGIGRRAEPLEDRPGILDHAADQVGRAGGGVAGHHLQPAAQEIGGPGGADGAGADDADPAHGTMGGLAHA